MGKETFSRKSLDTLAQSGTAHRAAAPPLLPPPGKIVYGEGSDLTDKPAWKRKAKRKLISQKTALSLIEVAEKKGEPERKQAFWNTYHCQNQLSSSGGRMYGKFCKNRFCTLCCSIRKAEIINRYLPVIKTWQNPYFVTLTIKAVTAGRLPKMLFGIKRAFRQIREAAKKRQQRTNGPKLIGIKSLECNFNPANRTYNPHLHLIVPDRETAVFLIVAWQRKWTKAFAGPAGQHYRKVKNIERDLVEIVKYGSKIFTEPDLNKKAGSSIPRKVYVAALDTIFRAMKPYRLFERFGFNLPQSATPGKISPALLQQYEEWSFDPAVHDWLNPETGEALTGYMPTAQLQALLSENIDTDLQ